MSPASLEVRGLGVAFGGRRVVRGLSFDVAAGETVALAGASGAGKSATALALLGLLPRGARAEGEIRLLGRPLSGLRERDWSRIRGRDIAMVFQDPLAALSPAFTVGAQVAEAVRAHAARRGARARAAELLESVGIPSARHRAYPGELSGGMRQRVLIAMAVAHRPAVLVADEPTASLDPLTRDQILDLLRDLCAASGTALLLISHDAEVIARQAARVLTLGDGRPSGTPRGPAAAPFSRGLASKQEDMSGGGGRGDEEEGAQAPAEREGRAARAGAAVLVVRGLGRRRGAVGVLDGVALEVGEGEIVGLSGASGAGKTTLLREVLLLERPQEGRIEVCGRDVAGLSRTARRELRGLVQPVFQDPWASLNPRMTVRQIVAEPLRVHGLPVPGRVEELLELVELPEEMAERHPRALSGGQRQRVAIARALAPSPRLLLADEPVSALDARAKAGITELLGGLRDRLGLACLLVSHDEDVLAELADRVLVLRDGRIRP
ncbi:ABC transporter ATP-binding protein [Actinocorallia aurantiaca]|uniref:ABC transporter ATP-binding protein n=1 Tax=Actinocorallia aurantiaca TaxID=46204 RepID=A0ABP6H0V2_9ACTN